ncbi:uncharacterized protein LOC143621888 [Bidens hawaiensis]|uniref:uncharacterized protein LOC143621888 n=1 Tax=Bidens hawaiensis TaxID=980011 RepID=UPI00404B2CBC
MDDNLNAIEESTGKSMAANNEKTSLTCSSPILKRNLIDVYDVDHPLTQSTTKSHSVTTVVDEETGIQIDASVSQDNRRSRKILIDKKRGVSKDYLDHGDQSVVCVKCHSNLWKDEAKRGQNKKAKGSYSLCCRYGSVELPQYIPPNQGYEHLFRGTDATSKFFLNNIRRYNSMFSFTSMGGKIDTAISQGKGPYVFRLSGQNYHKIGSLQPEPGCKPNFSQLYIYDIDNELSNRQQLFSDSKNMSTVTAKTMDLQIIQGLKEMLDSQNILVKMYRMARDSFQENPHVDLKIRLIANRQKDGRTYNLPTTSEVVALIVGDICDSLQPRDVVVTTRGGKIIPISELHPSYVPLQYPIIFPNGEDGYRVDIYHRGVNEDDNSKLIYTIEFQKRGLPHAHLCLFMHADNKLPNVEHIDPFISAEIPNKNEDPELYHLVSELMIHGPCGAHNPSCSCMVDNKCSKNFQKNFRDETSVNSEGYPLYRRRNSGQFVQKGDVQLDNRSVVPYNNKLLKRYQAHINVEWCNQASSIKYLFKYINKGPDRATVYFSKNNTQTDVEQPQIDEIKQFYDCRCISACEATWRIFGYDVHYRMPSVTRLPFHLPGQQHIVYGANDDLDNVLDKSESVASSMFTSWMKCNEKFSDARNLSYVEFPTKFVWHAKPHCWQPRKTRFSVGTIHAVSPAAGEAYFLRILLNKVKGPRSFEEIRTVNGRLQPSFRDACYSLGLLDDDQEYNEAIEEASHSALGHEIRTLFARMLSTDSPSRPEHVWMNTWKWLSDDILYNQ